ncbi:MAG: hypothetical protein ACRD2O_05860 [Terriglobia bacterium]
MFREPILRVFGNGSKTTPHPYDLVRKLQPVAWYNFCRVRQTLRLTSAMEAWLSGHTWTTNELASEVA